MGKYDKQLEKGVYIGNQVDKANLRNPISRWLVNGFDTQLLVALDKAKPKSVHEVGCGEGRLTRILRERYEVEILATDFSQTVIMENQKEPLEGVAFQQLSIYDLDPAKHSRDVVACCEVLEHLPDAVAGARALRGLGARQYVMSVPREPIWRILNMVRLKYWGALGNTPGHLNHWNQTSFEAMLEKAGFRIVERFNPFPWLMVLAEPV